MAHPAHGPTRVHRSPSSTRAATAHGPTVLSLHSVLQGSTRYIALHVLALHPALQGHTRYMALHVYIKYTNLLETISIRIECIWGKDSYIIGLFSEK